MISGCPDGKYHTCIVSHTISLKSLERNGKEIYMPFLIRAANVGTSR